MIREGQPTATAVPTAELLSQLLETLEMEPRHAPDLTIELLRRELARLERASGRSHQANERRHA